MPDPNDPEGMATAEVITELTNLRHQLGRNMAERHSMNKALLDTVSGQQAFMTDFAARIGATVDRLERAITGDNLGNVGLVATVVKIDMRVDSVERRASKVESEMRTYRKVGLAIVTVFGALGAVVLWLLQVRDHIGPPKP